MHRRRALSAYLGRTRNTKTALARLVGNPETVAARRRSGECLTKTGKVATFHHMGPQLLLTAPSSQQSSRLVRVSVNWNEAPANSGHLIYIDPRPMILHPYATNGRTVDIRLLRPLWRNASMSSHRWLTQVESAILARPRFSGILTAEPRSAWKMRRY